MWDTVEESKRHLSHDRPCPRCGHALHTYLGCDEACGCDPLLAPGYVASAPVMASAAP